MDDKIFLRATISIFGKQSILAGETYFLNDKIFMRALFSIFGQQTILEDRNYLLVDKILYAGPWKFPAKHYEWVQVYPY